MSDSSRAPNIFLNPVKSYNPLRPLYNHDVLTHPNEEVYHLRLCNVFVVTPQQFLVFEYREKYHTYFDDGLFRQMWTNGIELQV